MLGHPHSTNLQSPRKPCWPPTQQPHSSLCAPLVTSTVTYNCNIHQNFRRDYGGLASFCGRVTTIKTFQSNPLVRKTLNEDGTGRVLVIDGGASLNCALVGDRLAEHGADRGMYVLYSCPILLYRSRDSLEFTCNDGYLGWARHKTYLL